jgi:hypothetical protein
LKENLAIQTIRITKKEEARYFTVRLPKEVKRIIGIETGLRVISVTNPLQLPKSCYWLDIPRSSIAGTLKLQSTDRTNVFYSKDILKSEHSLPQGDFSFKYYPPAIKNPKDPALQTDRDYHNPFQFWKPQPWTHNGLVEEETILFTPSSALINGLYTDDWGKADNQDIEYVVTVYIWYEVADCKKISP